VGSLCNFRGVAKAQRQGYHPLTREDKTDSQSDQATYREIDPFTERRKQRARRWERNMSGGDKNVEKGIPLPCCRDQKRRESRESKSSRKKNPGNEPANDLARGQAPEDQAGEAGEPPEAHGDLFLDHDPDVVRMVELLEGVGIEREVLLLHHLKRARKPELIPNV